MKNVITFAKRNVKEMVRDPVLYIFCVGFPVAMIAMFELINGFIPQKMPVFEPKALIPGIMMFSFSFVMLVMSLLVSKDKSTAFLKRLFTAPVKPHEFVLGYALPAVIIGVAQAVACVISGWLFATFTGEEYFSFLSALGLIASQLPILLISVFLGILFGTFLNEKSAPGLTSVFITGSGILGGAWMPLETMGGFETFCRFLPFYPSTYWGRIITGAIKSIPDQAEHFVAYSFDEVAKLGIIPVAVFLVLSVALSFVVFGKKMKKDC